MANESNNTLYIEGPSRVVDQLLRDGVIGCANEGDENRPWYESDRLIDWTEGFDFTTVRESDGLKTVRLNFNTKWSEPSGLVLGLMSKYHHLGLDFSLSWWNDACGGGNPLFGRDIVINGPYFGELFTKPIEKSCFAGNHGKQTVLALDHQSMNYSQIDTSLLRERGYSDVQIAAFTKEQVRDFARQAYPGCILVFEILSTPEEVLVGDGVVYESDMLNDLIAQTWGESWFEQRGIAKGSLTRDDLDPAEFDKLIVDAYPEYAEEYHGCAGSCFPSPDDVAF